LLDFRPKPEHATAATEVDDGPRHVLVSVLVNADRVRRREPKYLGDATRVDEIFGGN
jgi:hypothetical protein